MNSTPKIPDVQLAELIETPIMPEPRVARMPSMQLLDSESVVSPGSTAPAIFEGRVFEFLMEHGQSLGLKGVWRCKNARIDGLVELLGGQRLAIEIKYQMNWARACQAGNQFAWFHARPQLQGNPISGGIVFFESFSGDWAKRRKSARAETGWSNFYDEHHHVDGLRVDLLRLRDGLLTSFLDEQVGDTV